MLAFRRSRDLAVCDFETAELDLLESLLGQLIELLLDQGTGLFGPGTGRCLPIRPAPVKTSSPGWNANWIPDRASSNCNRWSIRC